MNKENKKYLTTSQLAKQLGFSVSTIKKYCRHGVLRFQKKSKNSYRLFVLKAAKDDLDLVNRLKSMGLSLDQIRDGRSDGIVHRSSLERALTRLNKKRHTIRQRLKVNIRLNKV